MSEHIPSLVPYTQEEIDGLKIRREYGSIKYALDELSVDYCFAGNNEEKKLQIKAQGDKLYGRLLEIKKRAEKVDSYEILLKHIPESCRNDLYWWDNELKRILV